MKRTLAIAGICALWFGCGGERLNRMLSKWLDEQLAGKPVGW